MTDRYCVFVVKCCGSHLFCLIVDCLCMSTFLTTCSQLFQDKGSSYSMSKFDILIDQQKLISVVLKRLFCCWCAAFFQALALQILLRAEIVNDLVLHVMLVRSTVCKMALRMCMRESPHVQNDAHPVSFIVFANSFFL